VRAIVSGACPQSHIDLGIGPLDRFGRELLDDPDGNTFVIGSK